MLQTFGGNSVLWAALHVLYKLRMVNFQLNTKLAVLMIPNPFGFCKFLSVIISNDGHDFNSSSHDVKSRLQAVFLDD